MEEWDRVVSASHSGLLRRLSEQGTCFVFSNFYGVGISDKGQAPHSAATVYIEMEILHPLRLIQDERSSVPRNGPCTKLCPEENLPGKPRTFTRQCT